MTLRFMRIGSGLNKRTIQVAGAYWGPNIARITLGATKNKPRLRAPPMIAENDTLRTRAMPALGSCSARYAIFGRNVSWMIRRAGLQAATNLSATENCPAA